MLAVRFHGASSGVTNGGVAVMRMMRAVSEWPRLWLGKTTLAAYFPRAIGFLPDGKTLGVAQFGSRSLQFMPTDAP